MKIFNIIKANARIEELERQLNEFEANKEKELAEKIKSIEESYQTELKEKTEQINKLSGEIESLKNQLEQERAKSVEKMSELGIEDKRASKLVPSTEFTKSELLEKYKELTSPKERTEFLLKYRNYFSDLNS